METEKTNLEEAKAFIKRLTENVKEAYNIWYNENTGEITFWLGNIFTSLNPQFDERDGSLLYTTITLEWMDNQLKILAKLYLSTGEVELEDWDRTITFKYTGKIEEDPIILVDEQELFNYLNEISKITDLDEFIRFIECEFTSYSGLD